MTHHSVRFSEFLLSWIHFFIHSLLKLYQIMLLIVHSFLVIFQVTCCNKISSSYHYYGHGVGHQRPNIFLPTRAGCRGSSSSTVCEEVDNYPEEHMKNILENLSDEQRVVFLSNTKKIKGGEVQKMDFHYFGFASNSQETPVCGTQKQTHHPAIAVTWNNEERYYRIQNNSFYYLPQKCWIGS